MAWEGVFGTSADTKRKFVVGSPGEGGQAPGRKQIESIVVKIGQGLTYARNGNRDDATICSNRDAAIWLVEKGVNDLRGCGRSAGKRNCCRTRRKSDP
jgi:hypothetical protein